jgi:hypothetical protein
VKLGAVDSRFFAHYFFPKTARTRTPEFHMDMWSGLDSIHYRHFAAEVFRGGAKTSLLRVYTAKRVAYGISNTILFVGKGQDHSVRSVTWLRKAIEFNQRFARAFGLKKGEKWTDVEIEILRADGTTCRVLAVGITGQVRGVNIDDYRPDLIVVDDPCDEENTATPEQRAKISDLFFGALDKSLAPINESPFSKMVLLQTPLNREDLVEVCMKDPQWHGVRFSCFDERGESRWPERWTTKQLMGDKLAHINRNQLSIWLREMECELISPESTAFKSNWLKYWDVLPDEGATVLVIDPVPPPTEIAIAQGLAGKDYEALAVVRKRRGRYYVCEISVNRGHEPTWTVSEFFRLAMRWKPIKVVVETTAYQATLAWLIRQAMKHRGLYWPIEEFSDRRKKFARITDSLSGPASEGALYCRPEHSMFVEQFSMYPQVSHDDALEAVAVGVMKLNELGEIFDEDSLVIEPYSVSDQVRDNYMVCP